MLLEELCESTVSMRRTIWSRRGERITRRETDRMVATDVVPRTRVEVKEPADAG